MVDINPKKYNLSSRVKLKKGPKGIFIFIDRKSRVVMKDGYKIINIVKKIKQIENHVKINVLSSAPICSKTKQFLFKKGVFVKSV